MKSLTVAAPLFSASMLVSVPPLCQAAEQGWQWTLTPYLWTSSIDGTVEANGREADVDVGFGDILDNVNFGFLGHAEATKGNWSWAVSPVYTSLSADAEAVGQQGGQRNAEVNSDTTIVDAFGAYRFVLAWEVLAGIGRFLTDSDSRLQFDTASGVGVTFDPAEVLDIESDVDTFRLGGLWWFGSTRRTKYRMLRG